MLKIVSEKVDYGNMVRWVKFIPGKPLGVLLPGVVSWLPVPQPPIAVETFDIVTMACQVKHGQCEKRLQENPKKTEQ